MKTRRLGQSAIHVTDICMGTMTFGSQTDEAEALRILDRCFDEGINFYDTAEGYPVPPDIKWVGRTEEIVGRWLKTKNQTAVPGGPARALPPQYPHRDRSKPDAAADRLCRPLPDALAGP